MSRSSSQGTKSPAYSGECWSSSRSFCLVPKESRAAGRAAHAVYDRFTPSRHRTASSVRACRYEAREEAGRGGQEKQPECYLELALGQRVREPRPVRSDITRYRRHDGDPNQRDEADRERWQLGLV